MNPHPTKPPIHKRIRKSHIAAACLAALATYGASAGGVLPAWSQPHAAPATPQSPPVAEPVAMCDSSLWDHVYNPQRLQIVDPCKRVTGTVQSIRREADGDDHIQLAVDPAFGGLVNSVNQQKQNGDLVLEIICQHTVTQADAIQACMNYQNSIPEPTIGSHFEAVGSYVIDQDHGGWAELHPLTKLNPT